MPLNWPVVVSSWGTIWAMAASEMEMRSETERLFENSCRYARLQWKPQNDMHWVCRLTRQLVGTPKSCAAAAETSAAYITPLTGLNMTKSRHTRRKRVLQERTPTDQGERRVYLGGRREMAS